jgi:DNA-binding response OmpR family regulator
MRVLIAEDEAFSRQLLERALRRFNHEVVAVADGEEAWRAMQGEWFRVVISDWMMPNIDGLELCQRIRARKESDYVYFILLTGQKRSHENLIEAIEAGVDDFLSKPFEPDEVMTRLRVAQRILGYTTRIRQLEEILPICSYCKKIRNDQQYWTRMEEYFNRATGVDFSHSICPDCYASVVQPQIDELKAQMAQAKNAG